MGSGALYITHTTPTHEANMSRASNTRHVDQVIEPCRGATYYNPDQVAVYEYGVYPRSSVLSGQTRRVFLDSFDSVEEAKKAFPNARVSESCGYVAPSLSHLPDNEDGDLENAEREALRREQGL